jgi:biopolymer transport protein ExbB
MATIFQQGGWMMWPLLALSVLALAIICERGMFFGGLGFPSTKLSREFSAALFARDAEALDAVLPVSHPVFGPYFAELRRISRHGGVEQGIRHQEILDILAQEIKDSLDSRLPALGVIVRAAPLMGLLGTVFGMIETLSYLAAVEGGVDLKGLAGGIWQALLTTAAGLIVAIPVLLVQSWFLSRKKRVMDALYRMTGAVFTLCTAAEERGHGA